MSDAPDRIWADAPSLFDGTDLWHTSRETAEKTATEYVRADIFSAKDAENARLRAYGAPEFYVTNMAMMERAVHRAKNETEEWKAKTRDATQSKLSDDATIRVLKKQIANLNAQHKGETP